LRIAVARLFDMVYCINMEERAIERSEIEEQVRVETDEYPNGKTFTVYGMVEYAPVAGRTQGVWQWDGRYMPRIEGEENLSEPSIEIILEAALEQFAVWQKEGDI
jgi:hypothetical protein